MKSVIKLVNVSRRHPDGRVCPNDISLELYKGELTMITGGNGAGKSTLMRVLGLDEKHTNGTMVMLGHNVKNLDSKALAILRNEYIEYIPQKTFGLIKGSAFSNIQHLLEDEMPTSQAKQIARQVLEQVQTDQGFNIYKDISKLSGGEKGRVAIAIALARNTNRPICLVDEIFADVDKNSYIALLGLFRELADRGTAVAIIAHVPGIDDYFDRVITLENFRIKSNVKNTYPRSLPKPKIPSIADIPFTPKEIKIANPSGPPRSKPSRIAPRSKPKRSYKMNIEIKIPVKTVILLMITGMLDAIVTSNKRFGNFFTINSLLLGISFVTTLCIMYVVCWSSGFDDIPTFVKQALIIFSITWLIVLGLTALGVYTNPSETFLIAKEFGF